MPPHPGGPRGGEAPPPPPLRPRPAVPRAERVAAALLDAAPDAPSVEDRVVEEASTWSRIWKPFLNESIGWFIGAFLIVAGTFYGVSSAWEGLSSTARGVFARLPVTLDNAHHQIKEEGR